MGDNKKFKWVGWLINAIITMSIFIISTICLIGIILCIQSFISNQQSFNYSYTEAINAITSIIYEDGIIANETISNMMTHMENLQVIQKNSTTNDLMSFIYGILSTTLVGLCAGFVAKSKKSADESKETAAQARKDVQTVDNVKNKILKIQSNVKEELKKSKTLRISAEEQIKIQNNNTKLLKVHIEISHAKMSLFLCNQVESNVRIYQINKQINSFDDNFERQSIRQLRDELLLLKSSVDEFKNNANEKYTNGKLTSMLQSATRYYSELNESISVCEKIISK